MPQVLVNPESGLAEAYDNPQQIGSLLQSGYHVPLHDANGGAFSAPYQEAQGLIQGGQYRQPTPDELQDWMNTAKFSSPMQEAGALTEAALRGVFTGPVTTGVEQMMGIPASDILQRQQNNPNLALAGELLGTGAATLASEGLFGGRMAALASYSLPGIIGKAGQAASEAIGVTGAFGSIAQAATKGAVEAGLYSAQNQISELMMGDPKATGEHMLASIGLSAALGGGLGAVLKPVTNNIAKTLNKMTPFINGEDMNPEFQQLLDERFAMKGKLSPNYAVNMPVEPSPIMDRLNVLQKFSRLFLAKSTFGASELGKMATKFATKHLGDLVRTTPELAPLMSGMLGVHQIGIRTLETIENNAAGLFGYGAYKAYDTFNSQNEMHPLYDKLQEMGPDQDMMIKHLQQHTGVMAQTLPLSTQGFAHSINNSVQALSSQMPSLSKAAPLDQDKTISASQRAKFNSMANIIDKPVSLLDRLKDGTLTTQHVSTVASLYPSVYQSMQKAVMHNLTQYQADNNAPLPAKMRLGLSRFFGQPMDSSLHGLMQNQVSLSGINMAKQAAQAQQARPSKAGMGKMNIAQQDQTKAQLSAQRTRA